MNEILQLRGNKFEQKKSNGKPGPSNIPKKEYVAVQRLINLKNDLENVHTFWKDEKLSIKPLVSAYYTDVVAKSNRIKGILKNGVERNNDSIVGAKFTQGKNKKHIIVYCVDHKTLVDAINNLEIVISIIKSNFNNKITYDDICDVNRGKFDHLFKNKNEAKISRSRFVNTVVDAYYLEKFGIESEVDNLQENAIITIYNTGIKTIDIMNQLGIEVLDTRIIDETTILLNPDQYRLLKSKAPYLISMAVSDISLLDKESFHKDEDLIISIPHPSNEPTIGVIDTMFDESVYFSEWVEFKNMLEEGIQLTDRDYRHGTMVSSIIVDGASINPDLDDGCGRFKVKHFGVAAGGRFSSFTVLRAIEEIIASNRDIKVWNLSLGSSMEINTNFISPEAAFLDKLQYENDVIFVVAGTNKPKNSNIKRIGAPADSINSLVVNSVGFDNKPAKYSREGLVLSFFNKPDVSYYGGDDSKGIRTCSPLGECSAIGTSFAAPWIARKLAYLIEILGLTRELAKALIIDSATSWKNDKHNSQLVGYGVVPVHINEIIKTPDDEIKFMVNGISEKFDTYTYDILIPEDKKKQPFISKATLCYFPNCSRSQGVDYTNTEMDIHFGRLSGTKDGKARIASIDQNKQSDECKILLYEGAARQLYRKWDNIKHIRENAETPTGLQKKPKKKLSKDGLWGISVRTKERLNSGDGKGLKFGVVITLKEVNGINRMEEFMQLCKLMGWFVDKVDIKNKLDIYNTAEETIEFE